MTQKTSLGCRNLLKYFLTLCGLFLSFWNISIGPKHRYSIKLDPQGNLSCLESMAQQNHVLEKKEPNLIVIVIDFHGSIQTLLHWTQNYFNEKALHSYKVKIIATMKSSRGKFINMGLTKSMSLFSQYKTWHFYLDISPRQRKPRFELIYSLLF